MASTSSARRSTFSLRRRTRTRACTPSSTSASQPTKAIDPMPLVLTDLTEGVQTLTLNQPDKLNALSRGMIQELAEAVRAAERDANVRAIVLTGAGKGFSSGADISEFDLSNGGMDAGEYLRRNYNPLVTRLHNLEKPVLAAVNGVAAGAGL